MEGTTPLLREDLLLSGPPLYAHFSAQLAMHVPVCCDLAFLHTSQDFLQAKRAVSSIVANHDTVRTIVSDPKQVNAKEKDLTMLVTELDEKLDTLMSKCKLVERVQEMSQ